METVALYHLVEQQVCHLCGLAFYGPQLKSAVKSESLPRLFHRRQRKGLYPKCSVGETVGASGSPQFSAVRA